MQLEYSSKCSSSPKHDCKNNIVVFCTCASRARKFAQVLSCTHVNVYMHTYTHAYILPAKTSLTKQLIKS